jgi:hypothetical protein
MSWGFGVLGLAGSVVLEFVLTLVITLQGFGNLTALRDDIAII